MKQHQWITLQVEIEKHNICEHIKWELHEANSTEFSAQIHTDGLVKATVKAINTLKTFEMLTVNLFIRKDGDFQGGADIAAFRYVKNSGGYKFTKMNNNHQFTDWNDHAEDIKQVTKRVKLWIKDLEQQANYKFIELLKQSAA